MSSESPNRRSNRLPLLLAAIVPAALLVAPGIMSPRPAVSTELSTVAVAEKHRSPSEVVVTSDGGFALTANQTSDSVSLVDLKTSKVVAETQVGARPFSIALLPGGKRALVTNSGGTSVSVVDNLGGKLTVARSLPVGDEPRGVCVSRDGKRAFVALAGEDRVVVINLENLSVGTKWEVGAEPWHMALTPDGKSLVVASTRSRTVSILNAVTGEERHTVKTLGRNLRHIAVSADGEWAYLPGIAERGAGVSVQNIDRGWVVGNRLLRVPLTEEGPREAITLDMPKDGVADVDGCMLSPDGKTLAITAAGTHEIVFLPVAGIPFVAFGGPGDFRDDLLQDDAKRFRRVKLGGRPLGATFTPDGKSVVVANYLSDSIQVVDVATGIVRSVALGGPTEPDLARRGEAIFYDANRSFGSWYSCNSCHTEGHTNGGNFDTLNDGGIGKPKKTLSLRGVARTAPYTWHGWNKDLKSSVHESMIKTMQAPEPKDEDVNAVVAFVSALDFRASPKRATTGDGADAIRRGEAVFKAKACDTCHAAPNYTRPEVYTVGLEATDDVYQGFNPPPLRGVYSRAPYLHDGRARTLEDVLTKHHRPSQVGGTADCTPAELKDLIAFLNSL